MAVRELGDNTPDGNRVGQTASSMVALWGATPVSQASGANQAALSTSSIAVDAVLTTVVGGYNEVVALLPEIRTALVNAGLMKGSA